jgi:CheY-like chemotaxis protein
MNQLANDRSPLVVIVDDEVDITTFLRLALEEHGYRVLTFEDAESAQASLQECEPDLVCLDLLMPRSTGLSLYAHIAGHPRLSRCPVVIISGLAVRNDLPRMLQRAGNLPLPAGFIDKPIDIDELVRTLDLVLAATAGIGP